MGEGSLAIRGVGRLLTMNGPPIEDAAVLFRDGRVAWVGADRDAPLADEVVDGRGCLGLPGLIDCHTHAVWAGSRAQEFERRLAGASYSEILESGGGILSTVAATRAATEDQLAELCAERLADMRSRGVTTVEVKSGYGLEVGAEVRQLRAARRAGKIARVRVLTTFLGAHTIPQEHRSDRARYVAELIDVQLPEAVPYADYIDAYVDRGAFTVKEGRKILAAGRAAGLGVRIHAEQVSHTGAAEMAAELGALSADHLERIDDAGIAAMAAAGTVAVLLPGAMLYLRDAPPPVRRLREAGVTMAVATDFNPGSSPVDNLWICATLATLSMGLTVEEALFGITGAAALALGRRDLGRLAPGCVGDMLLVRPPVGEPLCEASLIQFMGSPRIERVIFNGEIC